ncbi:MAG: hypothetical protein ACKOI2_05560 [Actinomycetota bacterium]
MSDTHSSTGPSISPAPSTEEAVVIVAAMEALWPRAVIQAEQGSARSTSWRFSGRWWARPHIQRRVRP